jgi:ATP-dependent Zn protease
MKFAVAAAMSLLLAEQTSAFAPFTPVSGKHSSNSGRSMAMDMDMPPAAKTDVPAIQSSQYGPTDVRYSDFLRLVNGDKIEKVTFSSDGSQLLGVDVDGTRIKIEALPNDPDLLSQLTTHKVRNQIENPLVCTIESEL